LEHTRPTPSTETLDGTSPFVLGDRVLFVAGRRNDVRFRVDLRDGTLSTPSAPKLLDGVVDIALGERVLFLCQRESSDRSALNIVRFDLATGFRIRSTGPDARAGSLDATFCTRGSQRRRHPRTQGSPGVQNI
jgi:hypothetical protein